MVAYCRRICGFSVGSVAGVVCGKSCDVHLSEPLKALSEASKTDLENGASVEMKDRLQCSQVLWIR